MKKIDESRLTNFIQNETYDINSFRSSGMSGVKMHQFSPKYDSTNRESKNNPIQREIRPLNQFETSENK